MTPVVPGSDGARRVTPQSGPAAPVTLVLSREVRAGHEEAFEEVLHRLAAEVGRQPGHLDVTVLRPPRGAAPLYDRVALRQPRRRRRVAGQPGPDRLVAEAGLHAAGELRTRYLSGLQGPLAAPCVPARAGQPLEGAL